MHRLTVGVHEELINNISHSIYEGDRIGIIGPNGTGKTTFLKTLAGIEEPQGGSFAVKGKIFYVPQVHVVGQLSGGQQSMAALRRGFESDSEVLLLDEPTNHLDVVARKELIDMIRKFSGVIVCVSHDVWFLKAITTKLWIIEDGHIRAFTGSYQEYQEELASQEASRVRKAEVLRKERKKLEVAKKREAVRSSKSQKTGREHAFDRSTGRGAQGFFKEHAEKAAAKIKSRFDKKEEEFSQQSEVLTKKKKKKVSGSIVSSDKTGSLIRVRDATVSISGKTILSGVSLSVEKGERVAILGRNGSGKSALIKSIIGVEGFTLDPLPYRSTSLRVEYLDQHYSIVQPEKTVLDNAVDFSGSQTERVRQHLSHFLFSDTQDVQKKANQLSGGMLARLAFVMLTVSPVDLLILDEPTNNLDIETIDAIIEILSEYKGGLIVISHDMDFLDRLQIQKAILLGDTQKTVQIDEGISLHDII